MAEYIEWLGWKVSDIESKKIIKMVDYEAMRAAFDEKFKETMQLIQNGETHLDNLAEGFHEADGVIFRMPAADVAPVVRCQLCRYCMAYKETNGDGFYLGCTRTWGLRGALDPMDFCSYGERIGEDGGESHEAKERGTEVS